MADVFTSIATAGGWQTNTVKPAWDLLFRLAYFANPVFRSFVDVRPARPTHQGDSVTLQITQNFSDASVTAAKTPLTDEVDVDATQLPATQTVTLTPTEYGFANVRTLKLANRSMVPVDPEIARAVGVHCQQTIDELLQDAAVAGTQVYRPNARATTGDVTTGDVLTSDLLMKGVTKLRANNVPTRDGMNYVGIIHPNVSYDIRTESGSGGWLQPMEYQTNERLFRGEIGLWQGIRFIENSRTRNAADGLTGTQVYRSFLLGQEALAEAVVVEPELRIAPVTDRLSRKRGVGWYADIDFTVFRNESLVRFETATAAA